MLGVGCFDVDVIGIWYNCAEQLKPLQIRTKWFKSCHHGPHLKLHQIHWCSQTYILTPIIKAFLCDRLKPIAWIQLHQEAGYSRS